MLRVQVYVRACSVRGTVRVYRAAQYQAAARGEPGGAGAAAVCALPARGWPARGRPVPARAGAHAAARRAGPRRPRPPTALRRRARRRPAGQRGRRLGRAPRRRTRQGARAASLII